MSLLEKIQQEVKAEYPLTSNSAKGIIEVVFAHAQSLWLFDIKTPGYPMKRWVHGYLVKGGNWTTIEDRVPLDTYMRELGEEFVPYDPNDAQECDRVAWLNTALVASAQPLWDYAYLVPEGVHGQKNKGPMAGIESFFYSKVDGDELLDRLGIMNKKGNAETASLLTYHLGLRSGEGKVGVLSDTDLAHGVGGVFGFGDDQVFARYIEEKRGVQPRLNYVEGIELEQLETNPNVPYAERPFLGLLRVNPLRQGTTSDSEVYRPMRD